MQASRVPVDTMDIIIRPPRETDLYSLSRLMGQLGYPATPEQVRERLAHIDDNPGYATRVAEVDGEVAGMIALQRGWSLTDDQPCVRVLALVVNASMRGRGVGASLMEAAEAWARERGACAVHLATALHRDEAHGFYERLGFERTGWRFVRRLD